MKDRSQGYHSLGKQWCPLHREVRPATASVTARRQHPQEINLHGTARALPCLYRTQNNETESSVLQQGGPVSVKGPGQTLLPQSIQSAASHPSQVLLRCGALKHRAGRWEEG